MDWQLIIDKWQDQSATEWTGQITREAGRQYSIRMEFYERFWGAGRGQALVVFGQ